MLNVAERSFKERDPATLFMLSRTFLHEAATEQGNVDEFGGFTMPAFLADYYAPSCGSEARALLAEPRERIWI